MSWDAFQREVLAELGHVLYMPRHAGAQASDPDRDSDSDRASAGDIDPAMLAKLARAAGMDPGQLQAHAGIMAMAGLLRGDAAAKRALWPRLRELRRHRG